MRRRAFPLRVLPTKIMCGICGQVRFDGRPVERGLIETMASRIVHRGPDAEGMYVHGSVGLAQRRLAIIDLDPRSNAPLANEDGSVWITYNGEVYNFHSLRRDLEERGHRFRTLSDTEVLVHLY